MRLASPTSAPSGASGFAPRSQDPTRAAVPGAHAGSAAQPPDTNLIGRTSIGLMAIIGVILLCGYVLKRFGPYRRQNSKSMAVVASHSVGQRERVVIVDVEDKRLVLGVTPGSISKLHELQAPPRSLGAGEAARPASAESFSHSLRRAKARFVFRTGT